MRIAFAGAACTGKTTTLNEFLKRWPQYKVPQPSYRSIITEGKHSKNTTSKLQRDILQFMVDQQATFTLHDNIAYDRCVLDNIVYSVWAFDKNKKGFTEKYINESINLVHKGMRNLDIIFYMTRENMGPIEDNNIREKDPTYVAETDNIFRAIAAQISKTGTSPFFPAHDSPALIELTGSIQERMEQIGLYVTTDGTMFGEEQSLVNMDEIAKMEKLIREQKDSLQKEKGIL
jgi:hypothetical protein